MTEEQLSGIEARARDNSRLFGTTIVRPLIAEVRRLQAELARAKSECLRYESEIAAVCPEDFRLRETMEAVKRDTARRCAEIADRIGAAEFPANTGYCAGAAIAAEIRRKFGLLVETVEGK